MQATYSPDDNKLRLYSGGRLDAETFQRVKAAGFRWAPKQELFVAPAWTPCREDLLIELAGEVEDEDTSLVERAEQRAERFGDYSDKRSKDYESAIAAADRYTEPFRDGQPILVGHHSEKRARKDQERGNNAMRRAIHAHETAEYWEQRAAGSIAAAKYKERPDVRARRIKKIEADLRKIERAGKEAAGRMVAWDATDLTVEKAMRMADYYTMNVDVAKREDSPHWWWTARDVLRPDSERPAGCPAMTLEQVREIARAQHTNGTALRGRWIAHYNNRLTYERAMLAESGYVAPPKRVSRAVLPLLNYPGEVRVRSPYRKDVENYTAHPMTKAEYSAINKDYRGTRIAEDGTHRIRSAMLFHPSRLVVVFLTDAKEHPRPGTEPESDAAQEVQARINAAADKIDRNVAAAKKVKAHNASLIQREPAKERQQEPAEVETIRSALASGGVQVVVADQLFPTPDDLAARMVALADIHPGDKVLEPSAGTGSILRAIVDAETDPNRAGPAPHVTAVEINPKLFAALPKHLAESAICGNFLSITPDTEHPGGQPIGEFDAIVMNPPFRNGEDIKHILHAVRFLNSGGRLVAICANGPRQQAKLKALAAEMGGIYDPLPAGTFKAQGTCVNAALFAITANTGAMEVAA